MFFLNANDSVSGKTWVTFFCDALGNFVRSTGFSRTRVRLLHGCFTGGVIAIATLMTFNSTTKAQENTQEKYAPIQPFLNQYCTKCHGALAQEAEIRLDDINNIKGPMWTRIHKAIETKEMPPADATLPNALSRKKMVQLIDAISRDDQFSISTGFRRLNRREYSNTVRDLLGLQKELFNPGEEIFHDDVDDGFDTNSESLVISNELLLKYISSAKASLRMALFLDNPEKPTTKMVEYRTGKLKGGNNRFTTRTKNSTVTRQANDPIYGGESTKSVSVPGRYRIKVVAAGVGRDTYKIKFPPVSGPIKMGLGLMLESSRNLKAKGEIYHQYDLQDDVFNTYEAELMLEKGAFPFVSFLNGSGKTAAAIRQASRRKGFKLDNGMGSYRGPGVEIKHFSIEGPLDPQWPPVSYKTTFQTDSMPDAGTAEERTKLLKTFLERAYRRPVTSIELRDYTDFLNTKYESQTGSKKDWQEAFIQTFAAVMSSPGFLYIHEENSGALESYELANRLSYFLWSSMPDQELFALAKSGRILQPKVFRAQFERMLSDKKSQAFVDSFASQWLSLGELGLMPPDIKNRNFKVYHKSNLEKAFRTETLMYFRHVLFENQPLGDFLDSDYTFVNRELAKLYGIPFQEADRGGKEGTKKSAKDRLESEFVRVTIPKVIPRGGLLGHGSIHALTSNGVETLPVTRGHWVLDQLLGDPPPPPPKEVPALVPDLKGLTTPRDQLARHRTDHACAGCHRKMDPIGLALESYDMIGRFRERYETRAMIEPSGSFGGKRFKDVNQLRQLLRQNERNFARSLIIKLAEYAKGRQLNRNDLEFVDELVEQSASKEFRFKDLLSDLSSSKLMFNR